MDTKLRVSLLALLGVTLALAGAGGGTEKAVLATGAGAYHSARQLTTTTMLGMEEVHRRVLGNINPSSLNPDRPACIRSCPAAGQPYTGRGCQKVYQCRGG